MPIPTTLHNHKRIPMTIPPLKPVPGTPVPGATRTFPPWNRMRVWPCRELYLAEIFSTTFLPSGDIRKGFRQIPMPPGSIPERSPGASSPALFFAISVQHTPPALSERLLVIS